MVVAGFSGREKKESIQHYIIQYLVELQLFIFREHLQTIINHRQPYRNEQGRWLNNTTSTCFATDAPTNLPNLVRSCPVPPTRLGSISLLLSRTSGTHLADSKTVADWHRVLLKRANPSLASPSSNQSDEVLCHIQTWSSSSEQTWYASTIRWWK